MDMGAGGEFRLGIFSAVPIFKLWECFETGGEIGLNRRRDLRRGQFKGAVYRPPGREFLALRFRWPEPHSGAGSDVFVLCAENGSRGTCDQGSHGSVWRAVESAKAPRGPGLPSPGRRVRGGRSVHAWMIKVSLIAPPAAPLPSLQA